MQPRAPQTSPYPADAVAWLAGDPATDGARTVLVVGDPEPDPALVDGLAALGHDVRTTDGATTLPDDAVDVVVAVHAPPADLDEVARVLRPGGRVAFVVPGRDARIPWARKLDRVLGVEAPTGPAAFEQHAGALVAHGGFGFVEEHTAHGWQPVDRGTLLGLAARFPEVAALGDDERARRLEAAGALYDDYGRGADGMQLPWVARCYRATVRPERGDGGGTGGTGGTGGSGTATGTAAGSPGDAAARPTAGAAGERTEVVTGDGDVDGLLIDFR